MGNTPFASMQPILPTAHLLTCAGREGVLADTLADFARTDWPEAPRVHVVLPEPDDPTGSTGRGHLHLLRAALDGPGTHFLLLEDDLLFNRHLHHNLLHWSLRAWRERAGAALDYAHLYNPYCRPAEPPLAGADWFSALPRSVLGSQARLFSRAFARHVLDHFRGPGPIHDRRVVLMAAALGPVFLHRPSLVQCNYRTGLLL